MSNIMHSPFVIVLASALENDVPWSERFHHDYYGDFPPIPQLSLYLTRPLTYISQQWVPCILYVGYHNWWGSCEMMQTIIKTRCVETGVTGLFLGSVANFVYLIFLEICIFFKKKVQLRKALSNYKFIQKGKRTLVGLSQNFYRTSSSRQIRWKTILYGLIK